MSEEYGDVGMEAPYSVVSSLLRYLRDAEIRGAKRERERIMNEYLLDAHERVQGFHIVPEYDRGYCHALDDLYRELAVDGRK